MGQAAPAAGELSKPAPPRPHAVGVEGAVLALFGFLCGASVLRFGFYDPSLWGPAALAVFAVLFGLGLVRREWPPLRAALPLAGLLLLAVWSAISRGWAESPDAALTAANRWMLYAAVFAVLALLLRDRRHATLLLGGATAAVVVIGLYLVARMVFGDGPGLFLGRRLHEPLGYINAQGGFLLLGFWPLVAVAERGRSVLGSSLAAGAATMLAGLMVLSQARGVALAFVVSAVVVLAFVPGRRKRIWVLLAVVAGVALVLDPALDVYRAGAAGRPAETAVRSAGQRILAMAAVVALAWGAVQAGLQMLRKRAPGISRDLDAVSNGALVVIGLAAIVVLASSANTISNRIEQQADAFFELRSGAGGSRFLTGGGNRYDYWRIAVREFRAQPLKGQGAASYPPAYFLERRTNENIRQPHSIELQTLAELGVVGGVGLALFLAGVALGFARMAWAARSDPWARTAAAAAGGTFTAWLSQTSVDWLHLIPGLTAIALGAAAVLVAPWTSTTPRIRLSGAPRAALIALYAALIGVAAFAVGRSVLAQHYRSEARQAVRTDPARALSKANDSLAVNPDALPTYYVKAAALARVNRYGDARATLLEAARREPREFVTWALIGDIAVRRGDLALARQAYGRAARLNPRDGTLTALAKDPRPATTRRSD